MRALTFGGTGSPANINEIDYFTIASTGNATDFGDILAAGYNSGGAASETIAISMGLTGYANTIQFVTIASTGNATDFGDLTAAKGQNMNQASDSHGGLQG